MFFQLALASKSDANKQLSAEMKGKICNFTNLELHDIGEGDDLSKDWLFQTIESLKMYKAPGPDGLPNVMVICHQCLMLIMEGSNKGTPYSH